MPEVDGLEVARRARLTADRLTTYIIMLTGEGRRSDMARALECGVDDYAIKPFNPPELRARIQVGERLLSLQSALKQRVHELESALLERSRAQVELREAETKFRILFASSPLPTWLYDAESGRIEEVNDRAVALYGYSREAFLGMNISSLEPPGGASNADEFGGTISRESRVMKHRTRDGRTLDVEAGAQAFEFRGRRVVLLVAQDVTERERLELELRHAQKLESVGQLAAGIAHEINTPIQYVGDNTRFLEGAFADLERTIGEYERLRQAAIEGSVTSALLTDLEQTIGGADLGYLAKEIPKSIAQSLDGVQRVATIVRAMKEFAHPGQKEKAAADLNNALANCLIVARNELKYVADVETEFGELPPVICNIADLSQVFLNLLINAAQAIREVNGASGKMGRILIRTTPRDDSAVISISDTGCGIPESIQSRVYDPFFTTKPVGAGTGQGLAIARAIVVEKHGGTIRFEPNGSQGTVFIITLPLEPAMGSHGSRSSVPIAILTS
jgi:PAS domain S-box-containing protein